jgi:hypothetical protein
MNIISEVNLEFDKRLFLGEDTDFLPHLAFHYEFLYLDHVLSFYRTNQDSLTHQNIKENYRIKVTLKNIAKFGQCDKHGNCISDINLSKVYLSTI